MKFGNSGKKCRWIFSRGGSLLLAAVSVACLLPLLISAQSLKRAGERRRIFGYASELLDTGMNQRAAEFLKNRIRENPADLELSLLLIKSMARMCDSKSSAGFFEEIAQTRGGRLAGDFAGGVTKFYGRDFSGAISSLGEAVESAASSGDSVSLCVCRLERARSFIGQRDSDSALREAEAAEVIVRRMSDYDRLYLESLSLRAEACNIMDRLDQAESLLNQVIESCRERSYRGLEGFCLNSMARLMEKRQNIGRAEELYRKSYEINIVLNDRERTAATLNNLGQIRARAGDSLQAREYLVEARSIAESCGSGWILGYIYYGLGSIEESGAHRSRALEFFSASMRRHREHGNRWGEFGARLRVAYNLAEMGRYSESISNYALCAQAYESMKSDYGLSWALGGLAMAHHKLGDLDSAEKYYKETLKIRRRIGDRKGEAWCLSFLAMASNIRGAHEKALTYGFEAADIYRETGDKAGEGMADFSLGSAYFYLGNYRKSLARYNTAYRLAMESGDIELLQRAAGGLGSLYSTVGREEEVEVLYGEALKWSRKQHNHTGEVWALNNLASHCVKIGRLKEAKGYLERAGKLLESEGLDNLKAGTSYLLSEVETDTEKAIEHAGSALELAEKSGFMETAWRCASQLGKLYLSAGDTSRARNSQEKAIEIVESIRRMVGADELRRHILEPAIIPYERMIEILLGGSGKKQPPAGKIMKALEYSERSRAGTFAGMMRKSFAPPPPAADPSLVLRERQLLSELTFLQRKLQEEPLDSKNRTASLERIEELEEDFERLQIEMAAGYGFIPGALWAEGASAGDLVKTIEKGEAVLSYFLGENGSWLFFACREHVKVYPVSSREEIEKKVRYFLSLIRQSARGAEGGDATGRPALPGQVLEAAARELWRILVGPAASDLEGIKRIILVPDGFLNYLPFQLLEDDGGFLMRRHEFFSIPSLRILSYTRSRRNEKMGGSGRAELPMLSVGCEGISLRDRRIPGRVFPYRNIRLKGLPHAAEEARSVAALFSGSVVLTGERATEDQFNSIDPGRFDIIHIASHSYIDDEDVRRSFILFNPAEAGGDPVGSGDEDSRVRADGLLQWHEVTGLKLSASLVTLSACESAGGVLSRGEGITGLTRAFLYSGADCVLASVVDIPDRLTEKMMMEFYSNFREGYSAAESLRRAQLEMSSRNSGPSPPGFWAAFILVGDGSVKMRNGP